MKSVVAIALLAVTVLSMPAEAARADEKTIWRIRAGVNTSTLAGSDANRGDLERRQGFIVGLTALVHVTPRVGVEFGGFYSQKGTKGKITESEDFNIPYVSGSIEGTARFHYIELPLLVNVAFPVRPGFMTLIYAGPALALKTTAELSVAVPQNGGARTATNLDLSSWTTNFDAVAILGATAVFKTGSVNLLLGFRWARGLRSVDDTDMSLDVFNSTFSLLAGIGIPTSGGTGRDSGRRGVFQ